MEAEIVVFTKLARAMEATGSTTEGKNRSSDVNERGGGMRAIEYTDGDRRRRRWSD